MCREHKGLLVFASLFGLLQSALWAAATAVLILIYYCVIPIADYKEKSDFFSVTLIKLYFEGPKCIPNGDYLGKFNEDYRTSFTLIGREVLMFALIGYVILSAIYFVLSILLYLKRRRTEKRLLTIGWSVITLILCALDFLITYAFIIDSFTLMDYFEKTPDLQDVLLGAIPYIPLLLSFVSSRFVVIWIWNFFIGIYVLFLGLCGSVVPEPQVQAIDLKAEGKTPSKAVGQAPAEKPKVVQNEPQGPTEDGDGTLSLIRENFRSDFPSDTTKAYPEYNHYRRSMEAVTTFSDADRTSREYHPHNWCYEPHSEMPSYMRSHPQIPRMKEETNEGYMDDEQVDRRFDRSIDFQQNLRNFESGQQKIKITRPYPGQIPRMREETNEGYMDDDQVYRRFDRSTDFQQNLRNFESGQQKIKITRPHPGKSVGIPVPPPLPPLESCNC